MFNRVHRWRLGEFLASCLALVTGFLLGRTSRMPPSRPHWVAPPDQQTTRLSAARQLQPGAPAAGGFFAGWPAGTPDGAVAEHIEFQYADLPHQTDTAMAGMWLFLATEVLFFGGLFLLYAIYRARDPDAIAEASRHAEFLIGTINTVILLTSSAVFVFGLHRIQMGNPRALFWACVGTGCLGLTFLLLKGYEWKLDFDEHLFPGPHFSITGAHEGPAKLFWAFYFVSTALHGLHMTIGLVLVAWIAHGTRKGHYSAAYHTPVEMVGLYWSFVDMVWIMLYPSIYLAGGAWK